MLKLATKFYPDRASFERAHQAGFRCAELYLDASVLSRAAEVEALALDYPFEYAMHFPNHTSLPPELADAAARLYRALRCRAMPIHRPMFDRFAPRLLELVPEMKLGVENHRMRLDQFEAWATATPGLTFDIEHLWMLTLGDSAPLATVLAEARRIIQQYRDRIEHVHLPGYVPGYDEHRPMYCNRDFVFGCLDLLAEIDFTGLIVSEVHQEFQNPIDLQMDVLLFNAWRSTRA